MKRIAGILCCVAFILTSAACLVGSESINTAKDHQGIAVDHSYVEQAGPTVQVEKATTLEIVWEKGCPPCRRMKVVAIRLVAEGYDVTLVEDKDDTRDSRAYPTLYYLDSEGYAIRTEIGFKPAEHVKKYLGK